MRKMDIICIERGLKSIIVKMKGKELSDIDVDNLLRRTECDLVDDLGFDSFLLVRLLVEVEKEFNMEFSLDELQFEVFRKYHKLRDGILKHLLNL